MLKDRLFETRKKLGYSREKLAELAGVSTSTITFLENGRNDSSKFLVEIANALGVSAEWLKDGVDSISMAEITPISSLRPARSNVLNNEILGLSPWDEDTPLQQYEVEIPFYKDILLSAGNGCFQLEDYSGRTLRFSQQTLRDMGVDPSHAAGFTASGPSMSPVIPDGCAVVADISNKSIKDGGIYAIDNGGLLQIKILKWKSGSEVSIESYNPEFPPEVRRLDQIKVIGKVFWYSVLLK